MVPPFMCSGHSKGLLMGEAMVRNFLWTGTITGRARAKVSWDTAIRPLSQGGIKIFDPETQARALLGKLVTKRLVPRGEPWKLLIRHRLFGHTITTLWILAMQCLLAHRHKTTHVPKRL